MLKYDFDFWFRLHGSTNDFGGGRLQAEKVVAVEQVALEKQEKEAGIGPQGNLGLSQQAC